VTLTVATFERRLSDQAIHAAIAHAADGSERPLWAHPVPGLLVIRHDQSAITFADHRFRVESHRQEPHHAIGEAIHLALIASPTRGSDILYAQRAGSVRYWLNRSWPPPVHWLREGQAA